MARDWASVLTDMMAKAKSLRNPDGTNSPESEAYFTRALELADKHGVDVAMLEASASAVINVINKRLFFKNPFAIEKQRLFGIIARHFNCQIVFPGERGRISHVFGFPNDLSLTDVLFDLLWEFGASELEAAVARQTFYNAGHRKRFVTSFWYAYQAKIADRLRMSRVAHLVKTTGAELVLVRRTEEVTDAKNTEYTKLTTVRSYRSVTSAAGLAAGTAAGNKANLGHVLN